MEVSNSLRTLMAHSIDYAGVFPPARVPLDQALRNYAGYRRQPDSWMLGRFVCPVEQLSAMSSQERLWRDRQTRVAVVGTAGGGASELLDNFHGDVQAIVEFHKSHGKDAHVQALELNLPAVASESAIESVADFVRRAGKVLRDSKLPKMDIFLETASDQDWELRVAGLLRAIEMGDGDRFGLKIRLGGLPEYDMPSPDQLAFFINACRATGVFWKATAGLHHPMPDVESTNGESQFGFLNLFAAAVLASVHRLTQSQVTSILMESSISKFSFEQTSFAWGEYRANLPGMEQGRRQSMASLGSCSFDEPRDGLRDLGLIAS